MANSENQEITTKNPFVDLHCHLQFADFDEDRTEILAEMQKNNVIGINVGVDEKSSRDGISLSQKYPELLWSTVGLHPLYPEGIYDIEDLLKDEGSPQEHFCFDKSKHVVNKDICGIGECGLDYFRITADNINEPDLEKIKDFQKEIFINQIKMSIKYDLPLMLHVRDSYSKTLEILKENFIGVMKEYKGNVHFFAGTIDEAKEFLDLGFSISFTGVVTFVESYEDLIKYVPIERMFAETDSPYVSPKSFRGQKNNPNHVREIYKKIAEIKDIDINEVIDVFYNNAKKYWLK